MLSSIQPCFLDTSSNLHCCCHQLSVDRKYQPSCPQILYRTSGDNKVFPKVQLDPVDQKHLYVPFTNQVDWSFFMWRSLALPVDVFLKHGVLLQVKRVPVSNCRTYQNVKDCLSAKDPFCVWCVSKKRSEKLHLQLNPSISTLWWHIYIFFSCSFKDDCTGSERLSIPDESKQKIVSHRFLKDSTGEVGY